MGFDVVGDGMDGDVMGDVMGEEVVGAIVKHRGGGHRVVKIPPKPAWRKQLAPGVIQPDEGMVQLPLEPQANGGTFTNTLNAIEFRGQLQKPFRAERLLVGLGRVGPGAASPRILGQIYIGTDLQGADITPFDLELVGQANSFGTRLTLKAAEPGVIVRILAQLSSPLPTTTDTIFASMMFLGRIIA